jgi:hypothetical protein
MEILSACLSLSAGFEIELLRSLELPYCLTYDGRNHINIRDQLVDNFNAKIAQRLTDSTDFGLAAMAMKCC